ncbi:MAG: 23S rRNA (uracil(1939)-C(5))-methyltransferase RlmD [Candidatus Eisenbacteria bacterium]|uniref:23S rRNA (Uracil(1939)-C(5))-methyltransferase RlmD n=1 Tax=Eiseniibacteriota bacterium TaxID=2212470 RepID=A0A849SKA2_UNCEI|nr:23S rRNA (uracil(1939)-C(5))-methyltransferase RlmD [Candidatus Eisenbacteria bacterium]
MDRGLPGDRVEARVSHVRRRWADARLERVEPLCPDRVPPRCSHVHVCGGCRFQDLALEAQVRLKERHVRETLERIGGLENPQVRPIVAAPDAWRYRNKMEFSFAPDSDGSPQLGLHVRGAFDRVFELEDCLIASELTVEVVRLTQRFARAHRWPAYHPRRHEGIARFLVVRHLPLTDQCAVHLVAASDQLDGLDAWAREVAATSPAIQGVSLLINRARANVAIGEEERLLQGRATVVERLLGLEFEAGAASFLQTNSRAAEGLYQGAIAAAAATPDDVVLDLYCGTGTLTLLFARVAGEAIGVESVEPAVIAARANAVRNRVTNARFEAGESRAVLRQWARGERAGAPRPSIVVVDPPRAGLHPRVVARIAELTPRRVIYVSCNPATLARDLKDFAALGFALDHVTPFDLFPHTPHIECVARLERTASV